jgi:hypothetical protein
VIPTEVAATVMGAVSLRKKIISFPQGEIPDQEVKRLK